MTAHTDPLAGVPDGIREDPHFKLGAAEQAVRILLGRDTLTDEDRNTVANLAALLGIEVTS